MAEKKKVKASEVAKLAGATVAAGVAGTGATIAAGKFVDKIMPDEMVERDAKMMAQRRARKRQATMLARPRETKGVGGGGIRIMKVK